MNKMINVTRSSMPPFDEYIEEIKPLWENRWLTNMGDKHNRLESELKHYLDVDNLSLMVNGHMALELGLQAMGVKGEVITTPFTFASTTHAIIRSGSTPIFCDINPQDYTIDVGKIEALITDKTAAIVPVHVYGNVCDVEGIDNIAKKYGLKVIYDAAHAFGERYKNKGVMRYGDMSMMSFHATKVFHTIEGGALVYEDEKLKSAIEMMRDFGIRDEETVVMVGANAKMNEFAASMGLCNLRHIDEEIEKRKRAVDLYKQELFDLPGIKLNCENTDTESNYAYFPILVDETKAGYNRDEMQMYLRSKGVNTRKYFYPLTNSFGYLHERNDLSKTPNAVFVSNRILTLPLFADLQGKDITRICEAFHEWRHKAV